MDGDSIIRELLFCLRPIAVSRIHDRRIRNTMYGYGDKLSVFSMKRHQLLWQHSKAIFVKLNLYLKKPIEQYSYKLIKKVFRYATKLYVSSVFSDYLVSFERIYDQAIFAIDESLEP